MLNDSVTLAKDDRQVGGESPERDSLLLLADANHVSASSETGAE